MAKPSQGKSFKFATLKREAQKKAEGREKRKLPPPFVLNDIEPPIVITAPDTVERQMIIAEMIGPQLSFDASRALPLLRALCGNEFPRVWALIKDDTEPDTTVALIQAMVAHFSDRPPQPLQLRATFTLGNGEQPDQRRRQRVIRAERRAGDRGVQPILRRNPRGRHLPGQHADPWQQDSVAPQPGGGVVEQRDRPFGVGPGAAVDEGTELAAPVRVVVLVVAEGLLDLPRMLVGGLLPFGVLLHYRRVRQLELLGEVFDHRPRHVERVDEKQPDVAPTRSTGTAMARALDRVNEISAFKLARVNLSRVPVNRLATLAQYGMYSKAAALERTPEPRRTALVTAVVRNLEAQAIDDALDLFALLMATRLISPARRASEKERLSSLPTLERASRTVTRASRLLIRLLGEADVAGEALDPALVWTMLDDVALREAIVAAMATVDKLVPNDDGSAEIALRKALAGRYNTVRPFLALLGVQLERIRANRLLAEALATGGDAFHLATVFDLNSATPSGMRRRPPPPAERRISRCVIRPEVSRARRAPLTSAASPVAMWPGRCRAAHCGKCSAVGFAGRVVSAGAGTPPG
jgi:hypothetical protein